MNQILYGTKKIWEVLRNRGAEILTVASTGITIGTSNGKGSYIRVPHGEYPRSHIIGFEIPDKKLRFITDWSYKFITTHEKLKSKELLVQGLLPIVTETSEMKEMHYV
jgi:hypothetical protein